MAGTVSSEKVDLLIYGPIRPILENGISDLSGASPPRTRADLERLTPDTSAKIRGVAVTYHTVPADTKALAQFPKVEIVGSFGVGYDHVDCTTRANNNVIVTNTPDVLTEEIADVAMGLLIATLREFVRADRYVRSGLWATQNYPLSAGSMRDRTVGIVGMGRIGKAIAPPARGLARSGLLSFAQSGRRRLLQALSRPDRDGEGGRYIDRDRAGRRFYLENDQCRRAEGARPTRRPDQRGARLGGRRTGADRGAEVRDHSGRRPRRVRHASRMCRTS